MGSVLRLRRAGRKVAVPMFAAISLLVAVTTSVDAVDYIRSKPSAPLTVRAVPANAQANISWKPPAKNGGSRITLYTATSIPGASTCTTTLLLTCTIHGLTNGTSYRFRVSARNSVGTGALSAPSPAVVPFTVPDVVTGITAVPGYQQIVTHWIPGAFNGGRPESYVVQATPGTHTCLSGTNSCLISGLTTGQTYHLTVTAVNAAGFGQPASSTVGFVPRTLITPGSTVTYTRFDNSTTSLIPWVGSFVAVLTPVGTPYDSATMTNVISALDASWSDYVALTGRSPNFNAPSTYLGRDLIAVVSTTCGAACSYLSTNGTEINPNYFQTLYDGVSQSGQYDQAQFYEFGRNFWYYGNQLGPNTTLGSTLTTGFAVFMRFQTMNDLGLPGAPFDALPFSSFESRVWSLAKDYDSNVSASFASTLAVGASPSVYGGTDFFASIVHLLAQHYGGSCFVRNLWSTVLTEPSVSTDNGAVTNFVNAASHVAGVNLGQFFYQYWGFPRSDGSVAARVQGGIRNLPTASNAATCPT